MNPSTRRVRNLGVLFFLGAMVLVAHLANLMVTQHETWEMRSYGNRWAFRDVPTKRGGIRDRRGEILVTDVPTTTLSLYYRDFRRRHPCGAAVHGANTALRLIGSQQEYSYSRDNVIVAFRHCMRLPLSVLRRPDPEAVDDEVNKLATDLRFYVCSLVAGLTDGASFWRRFREVRGRLAKALEAGRVGTLREVLGLGEAGLSRVFFARLDELTPLVDEMRSRKVGFFARLEEQRQRYEDGPPAQGLAAELVPRVIHRRLGYEAARYLSVRREWHPGLSVRPGVERQKADPTSLQGDRFESLAPLLGRATMEWGKEDEPRQQEILAELRPSIEAMAEVDAELSEQQRQTVQDRLRRTMRYHLAAAGLVGRSGVEKDLDPVLRGTAGLQWFLRSRRQKEIGLWSHFDVAPGEDVALTVDLRLQALAERAIEHAIGGLPAPVQKPYTAAFAVVDVHSGDILALSSRPLMEERHPDDRMKLPPSLGWWTPGDIGSLAKPLVLLEHLDARRRGRPAGRLTAFMECMGGEFMPDDGPYRRYRLRCDHLHGDGVHDPVESLGESCNYFFFQAAEGLGWPGVTRAYQRFGLFTPEPGLTPVNMQKHVPGIPRQDYPNPQWARDTRDLQRRAIGYGISANVLQMARAYAGLATGRLPELSLVVRDPESERSIPLGVHPDDLRVVHDGLRYCVEQGTGRKLQLTGVLAKTGTAEVTTKGHNNAWFAGIVTDERGLPKLAFASVIYFVPDKSYGGEAAGPMIQRFLEDLRRHDELRTEYLGR